MTIPVPPIEKQQVFRKFLLQWQAVQCDITKSKGLLSELVNTLAIEAFSGRLTDAWRKKSGGRIADAIIVRNQTLHKSTIQRSLSGSAEISVTANANLNLHNARHWLIEELGEFQRMVLAAFKEYCQQTGQPLIVEDPDVFARFCDDATVTDHLKAFGQSLGNRIRRSLSQLAALGLIAKITLPKQNAETGDLEYLKAFRPLRPEEFSRMADLPLLRKAASPSEVQRSYYFQVQLDRATSAHAGADGMFQVISLEDENGKDFTHLVDQGTHYPSLAKLKEDIAAALKVHEQQVYLETV